MQREIKQSDKLLNEKGELKQAGYATELILEYNRNAIKARSFRIKEWDYYLVTNNEFAVALTVADLSYMGFISVSLLDFTTKWYKTASIIKPFTFGKLGHPPSSKTGDITYKDRKVQIEFLHEEEHRRLKCYMKNFDKRKNFQCDFILTNEPKDSMVIAVPFVEDGQAFYYNQKINCMSAQGIAILQDKDFNFNLDNSFATLDWGRGVWTYRNTWYWASASGVVDERPFGFNLGYGFGDTTAATENMIIFDGTAHKLEHVEFHIPKSGQTFSYMETWRFSSNNNRLEMEFKPILDREDKTSLGILASDQHQVFGHFSGRIVLDDGTVLLIKDLLGFAERVYNRW